MADSTSAQHRLNSYYARTAQHYDAMHLRGEHDEHFIALARSLPYVDRTAIGSILDVGCGTGRALSWYAEQIPEVALFGVDPSPDMLEQAAIKVKSAGFEVASGEALPFEDGRFDLVCATGILHHAENPQACIREMFRVARTAVFVSDHNCFSFQGDRLKKIRLLLWAIGLLPAATFLKQGFRKQGYSEGDGYWYPYSLLDDYGLISGLAREVTILPLFKPNSDRLSNFLLCQSHFAIWAEK